MREGGLNALRDLLLDLGAQLSAALLCHASGKLGREDREEHEDPAAGVFEPHQVEWVANELLGDEIMGDEPIGERCGRKIKPPEPFTWIGPVGQGCLLLDVV